MQKSSYYMFLASIRVLQDAALCGIILAKKTQEKGYAGIQA